MGRWSTRWAELAGIVILASMAGGCTVGSSSRGQRSPTFAPPGASPGHRAHDVGRFRPMRPRHQASAVLAVPGSKAPRLVRYEVVDGMAVMQGDILLGPADSVAHRFAAPRLPLPTAPPAALPTVFPTALRGWGMDGAMPVNGESYLWPRGEIPYEIDGSVSAEKRSEIDWAIGEMATAGLKVRPRAAADADYVVFRDVGEGCNSHIGRYGGGQPINLSNCAQGVVLHELMHAVGFQHEHARSDRDQFVTVMWDEIADDMRYAFEKATDARDFGPYDYESIVHYPTRAFSKRGNPTLVPLTEGVQTGQHRGLSALDKAGIQELYGLGGGPVAPPGSPPAAPAASPWGLPPGWPQGIPGFPPAAPPGQPPPPGGQPPAQPPAQPPGSAPGWPGLPQGWPQSLPAPPQGLPFPAPR